LSYGAAPEKPFSVSAGTRDILIVFLWFYSVLHGNTEVEP
jgi:hypothetical protein